MRILAIKMNLLIVLCLLATCGPSTRTKTIKATLVATNAARDGFIVWDEQRQIAIVNAAASQAEGSTKLVEYRLARERIIQSFVLVYHLISAAAILDDDPRAVDKMLAAAKQLAHDLEAFRGKP